MTRSGAHVVSAQALQAAAEQAYEGLDWEVGPEEVQAQLLEVIQFRLGALTEAVLATVSNYTHAAAAEQEGSS